MTTQQLKWQRDDRLKDPTRYKKYSMSDYHRHREERLKYRRERHNNSPWFTMSVVAKRRAKELNLPFNIDAEYIESIYPADKRCPVFGFLFEIATSKGSRNKSPSLDRIRPELGYVKGNLVVVSMKANRMKNDGNLEDLKRILQFYQPLFL